MWIWVGSVSDISEADFTSVGKVEMWRVSVRVDVSLGVTGSHARCHLSVGAKPLCRGAIYALFDTEDGGNMQHRNIFNTSRVRTLLRLKRRLSINSESQWKVKIIDDLRISGMYYVSCFRNGKLCVCGSCLCVHTSCLQIARKSRQYEKVLCL
jgi:hypothetical protein